jgi:hypothetical protein
MDFGRNRSVPAPATESRADFSFDYTLTIRLYVLIFAM